MTPRIVPFTLHSALCGAIALVAAALLIGPLVDRAEAGSCPNASGRPGKISRKQGRRAVVCLLNNRRASHGKRKLDVHRGLQKSAHRHTRRMVRRNCFAHQCPGERDLGGRVQATSFLPCGCSSWNVAETIAWGRGRRGTPKRAVKSWMGSRPHRRVVLNGSFEFVGVGVRWGSPHGAGRKAGTYTADFGNMRG